MIKFNRLEKRTYEIFKDETKICDLDLIFNPITNKFDKIIEFIEDCSEKLGKKFDDWFELYINDYINSNYNHEIIIKHIPTLIKYTDEYLKKLNVNYKDYTNEKKKSKTSIYFDDKEIENLIKVSHYLKLFSIIYQDKKMKPLDTFYKKIYNILIKDIATEKILTKIFNIVVSKINRYKVTDGFMWDFISLKFCKTTDIHIIHIFNWIIHNILVTCDAKQNPITFITSVINTSISWILKNVYKNTIIYSESINTEDANSVVGKDKLKTYAYNDTIAKLLIVAYNCLEQEKIEDQKFKQITSNQKYIPTVSKYITFPLLCKALKIPYKHLMTISCEHAYLLNILVYHFLNPEFKKEYPVITNLLLKYNTTAEIKKTTHCLLDIKTFLDNYKEFLTTKDRMYSFDVYSSIIGKLIRNSYEHFKGGKTEDNIPKLESDIVRFYHKYFSNNLDNEIQELGKQLIDSI